MGSFPGSLRVVTAPAQEPLTLAQAKEHLRVDIADDDVLIGSLIRATRELLESELGRAFITQTLDYALDAFPKSGPLLLPRGPIQSVTSVSYIDSAGATQVWGSSNYLVDLYSSPPRITPAHAKTWPTLQDRIAAVTVRFVAGYGLGPATVPGPIAHAMLLLIGHYYEHREQVIDAVGANVLVLPQAAERLLANYLLSWAA